MVLTMATLLVAPAAMAERDDGPDPAPGWLMAIDFVFVRPPSFILSIASTAVYAASTPITYPTGVASDLGTYMVKVPWRFTASRYYGNFVEYRDNRSIRGALLTN
jgi:hypothetical protein